MHFLRGFYPLLVPSLNVQNVVVTGAAMLIHDVSMSFARTSGV
jgi:hypothetical protein